VSSVIILDGRNVKFNLDRDLPKLDKILPSFHQEPGSGSCALVGYTVNKFQVKKGVGLGFNLMWVVVVGMPE